MKPMHAGDSRASRYAGFVELKQGQADIALRAGAQARGSGKAGASHRRALFFKYSRAPALENRSPQVRLTGDFPIRKDRKSL